MANKYRAAAVLVLAVAASVAVSGACRQQAGGVGGADVRGPVDVVAEVRWSDVGEGSAIGSAPVVLTMRNHMGTAQLADMSLDVVDGAPRMHDYRAGEVAYWEKREQLVLFLGDGTALPPAELVPLGQVTAGLQDLVGCARDCTISLEPSTSSATGHAR